MSESENQGAPSAQDQTPEGDANDHPLESTDSSVEAHDRDESSSDDLSLDEASPEDDAHEEGGEVPEDPLIMSLPELTFPQEQSASLVINYGDHEARVAYLLDGVPTEFFFDRTQDVSLVGNIYKGRVVRVLPGMQAAFVDIGLKQAAFL